MSIRSVSASVLAGLTAVAGAGASVALLSGGTASAGTTASSAHTFTVRVHHGSDASIDLGATGFSAGDEDLFVSPVTRAGKPDGRVVGTCTTMRVARTADQLCEFVLHLRGGQITASGTFRSGQSGPGTFQLPILGGTGRYAAASGSLAVSPTSGSSFPIQVTLR
jgi:hypothetical protein